MNFKSYILFLYGISLSNLIGQTNHAFPIILTPFLNNTSLKLDSAYTLPNGDSILIEELKFYISNIQLYQNEKLVWKEKESYHLINLNYNKSLQIQLNLPNALKFNQLKFNLGIDSITNVSGVMGKDLDPTKGMYWAWQSGYINFKLEGKSNFCKTRNNKFQFHLGGYQHPFNSLQTVLIDLDSTESIAIKLNLNKIVDTIDLSNQIMSPSNQSVLLSKKVMQSFSIIK
jgi:hypothetical protein